MPIETRQIDCRGPDYEAVKKLRYAVCAEEEGLDMPGMDHNDRTLGDALDPGSLIVAAFDGDRAVGTMRFTPLSEHSATEADHGNWVYEGFPVPKTRQAVIGRLLVLEAYRGSSVCLQLFQTSYELCLRLGFEVGMLESSPRTVPLYESVGCRRYQPGFSDPQFGFMVPMAFLFRDIHHLRRVGSPLARAHGIDFHDRRLSAWFESEFAAFASPCSVRLRSRCERDRLMTDLKALTPAPLSGLDSVAIARLLRGSTVLDLDAGIKVLDAGNRGTDLYVVLEGRIGLGPASGGFAHGFHAFGEGEVLPDACPGTYPGWPFRFEARTLVPTRLLSISAEALYGLRRRGDLR